MTRGSKNKVRSGPEGTWALILGRLKNIYVFIAVTLFNLVVLFVCVEISLRLIRSNDQDEDVVNSVIDARDSTRNHQKEYVASQRKRYEPFSVWRRFSFEGDTINVDQNGVRLTPGADCSAGSYTISAFGGSAMWGAGVPDGATIPAFLQARLSDDVKRPLCVANFGESGYVARQSLALLLNQLHSGRIPDLVVFYDGFNDVYSAYENGEAGRHFDYSYIAWKFERDTGHVLLDYLADLAVVSSLRDLLFEGDIEQDDGDGDASSESEESQMNKLSKSIAQHYLTTYAVVEALSRRWAFDFVFFMQPVIWLGDKRLTEEEFEVNETYRDYSPGLVEMISETYSIVRSRSPSKERIVLLDDAFDEVQEDIWYDFVHVSEEGNELIADRMIQTIRPLIEVGLNE